MKKLVTVLLLMFFGIVASAQMNTIKTGVNINSENWPSKYLHQINYPSWDISYERFIGSKFSISGTINYAKRLYPSDQDNFRLVDHNEFHDWGLVPEGRYYLKQNSSGLFFRIAIPVTYTTYTFRQYSYNSSGQIIHTSSDESYEYSIMALTGFGVKASLTRKFGIEMMLSYCPGINFWEFYPDDKSPSCFISSVRLLYSPF